MEVKKFIDVWPGIYLFDLFRYLIPATIAFVVFWLIGKNAWKHRFIQNSFPENPQLVREFAYSMSMVVIFSLVGFCIYVSEMAGITRLYYDVSQYGIAYMIFSFVLTLIFHDFYFYWTHRFMHHKRIFKY